MKWLRRLLGLEADAAPLPPSGPRDWETIVKLIRAAGGNHGVHMSMFSDGEVWISVNLGSSKIIGKGRDPWNAVDDLAGQSEAVGRRARQALIGQP